MWIRGKNCWSCPVSMPENLVPAQEPWKGKWLQLAFRGHTILHVCVIQSPVHCTRQFSVKSASIKYTWQYDLYYLQTRVPNNIYSPGKSVEADVQNGQKVVGNLSGGTISTTEHSDNQRHHGGWIHRGAWAELILKAKPTFLPSLPGSEYGVSNTLLS